MTIVSVEIPDTVAVQFTSYSVVPLQKLEDALEAEKAKRIAYLKSIPDDKITIDEALELLDWPPHPNEVTLHIGLTIEEVMEALQKMNNGK